MDGADIVKFSVPIAIAIGAVALVAYKVVNRKKIFLDKTRKRVKIVDIKELSEDTKRFRLSLGSDNTVLGLPVGKHISIYAPNPAAGCGTWNGRDDKEKDKQEIDRKYTPTTSDEAAGYVDLVIKVYRPGTVTMPDGNKVNWENGGKLGLYLDSKNIGDFIEINGPFGVNQYLGQGEFKLPGRTKKVNHVAMMAGGTGITPMLQVVSAALRDPNDKTTFSLIYANKTEGDILCRDLLEQAAAKSGGKFVIHYTLDFPPQGWTHKKGFITQDMIKECLPPPSDDVLVLMCGPPPMVEFACKKNLEALGYQKSSMANF